MGSDPQSGRNGAGHGESLRFGTVPKRGDVVRRQVVVAGVWIGLLAGTAAEAQDAPTSRPAPIVEGSLGWAGFGDEGIIHHTLLGAGARYYLSRRFSIGPELQYMVGPDSDRDLVLTGNVVFDVLGPTPARPRRTTPYLVAGGGLFRHSQRFFDDSVSSTEGAFTAGVGLRGWVGERVFVAADARIGWEPHLRLAGTIGVELGR